MLCLSQGSLRKKEKEQHGKWDLPDGRGEVPEIIGGLNRGREGGAGELGLRPRGLPPSAPNPQAALSSSSLSHHLPLEPKLGPFLIQTKFQRTASPTPP